MCFLGALKSLLNPQVDCAVDISEPIFQPFPPEVAFHSFEPFKTYEALLYLRNNDKVGPPDLRSAITHSHQHIATAAQPVTLSSPNTLRERVDSATSSTAPRPGSLARHWCSTYLLSPKVPLPSPNNRRSSAHVPPCSPIARLASVPTKPTNTVPCLEDSALF